MALSGTGGKAMVYPRVCGGTPSRSAMAAIRQGLSPRVRGNPRRSRQYLPDGGSIPACAGEPPVDDLFIRWRRVYPRVCGGTRPGLGAG